jgi:hypothetical protein
LSHALCAVAVLGGALAAAPAYAADAPAGPELRGLVVAPRQVDVSRSYAVAGVTARVAGAASGVTAVTVRLGDAAPVSLQLTGGTPADGTWSGVVTVPAFTPYGAVAARVYATDAAETPMSAVVDDAVQVADAAPGAPAAIGAAPVPDQPDALRVTWAAPAPNGTSPVLGYDVTATPVAGDAAPVTVPAAPDAVVATLTGLAPSTRYAVRVAARNATGSGAPAAADAATTEGSATVPDGPTSVTAVPGDGTLRVAWTPPVSDGGSPVTGYEVRATPRVAGAVASVVSAGPDLTFADLPAPANGAVHDVAVTARTAAGASLPAVTVATPRTVPGAPVVTARAGDASATVSWAPPASDGGAAVESYTVTAAPSGATVTLPAGARSVRVPRLPNGVAARFTVTAANAAGSGAPGTSGAVTPRLPARLSVVAQPAGEVVYGTATSVRAALVAAGTGLPGQRVDLLARVRPATTWRRVATGTTGSTGRVTLTATLPASAALKLHHPAGAVAAPDVAVDPVFVASRVTASSSRIRLGMSAVVRGSIAPAHPEGSIVRLQRKVDGEWVTVASGRMTTTTAYRVAWRPRAEGTYALRVVKPADDDHARGVSAWFKQVVDPENAADIATDIRDDRGIRLETTHESGIADLAHPRQNIVDVAAGRLARRSAYQNAPGGYTTLDRRLLKALRRMGQVGTVTVSEIAGGSHSRGSTHYYGRGLDISWVNGRHVAPGSDYGMAVRACKAYGAVRVFSPAYDPYGGHQHHVHCDW